MAKLNMNCRVCGLTQENAEDFWGGDGESPSYVFCDCCNVEFGHEDYTLESTRKYREEWVKKGANWHKEKTKPINWSFEQQRKQIPSEWL